MLPSTAAGAVMLLDWLNTSDKAVFHTPVNVGSQGTKASICQSKNVLLDDAGRLAMKLVVVGTANAARRDREGGGGGGMERVVKMQQNTM